MRRKYSDRYLILLLPILYILMLLYIRFTIWLIILWLMFNVLRVLFKCIRLISLLGGYYIYWTKLYFRDRKAAADPKTATERLRKLSDGVNPNPFLCRVIARNPNTPTDVLLKLGEKFPKQLFANPVFDLLVLEDPNLLKSMPKDTLKSLLRLKEIPVSFLEQAAGCRSTDMELMKVIANHPKTPKYVLEKLTQHN